MHETINHSSFWNTFFYISCFSQFTEFFSFLSLATFEVTSTGSSLRLICLNFHLELFVLYVLSGLPHHSHVFTVSQAHPTFQCSSPILIFHLDIPQGPNYLNLQLLKFLSQWMAWTPVQLPKPRMWEVSFISFSPSVPPNQSISMLS